MKNTKTHVIVPILWFIVTAIWIIVLCLDFYYNVSPVGLTLLRVLCVIASLTAAITNLIRYINAKNENNTK